uniref:Galectin domain-containing protein n=1 Tax=Meloidogyne javanica TaxID=6303 RepID=A0A915LK28_MELJA
MVATIETATCNDPIIYNNLNLPATINLAQLPFGRGFLPDKSIVINGVVLANPDLFVVVRNNWIRNRGWGREETSGGFPFKAGQPFILEFVATPRNTIYIYINNQYFATFSRVDLSRISQLYIDGRGTIRVNSLTLCPNQVITTTTLRPTTTTDEPTTTEEPTTTTEEPTTTTEEPTTTTEEPTTTPLPTCPYPIVIPYPKIPATIDLLKLGFESGFAPPKRIIFVGFPTNTSDRFIINLYSDGVPGVTATTLFHFNPRFNEKQVIRNTWSPITGWGREERYGGFPFNVGEPFKIPATIDFVKLGFGTGFRRPKRIIIFGTPLAQPTAFNIHIGEPGKLLVNANVLFHMSPRFHENKVIRNTWIVGKGWEKEENYGGFPFKVGEPFVLELTDGSDNLIAVKVNNKSFVSFGRYNLDKVSQMEIENGVQVSSVILCPAHRPTTITKNPTTTTEGPTTTTEEPTTTTEETTTTTEEPTTTTRKPSTPTTKKLIPTTPILQYCPKPIVFNNVEIPTRIYFTAWGYGRGFAPPKRIVILGTPTARTRFAINLAEDGVPERTANIPFHFNPRFNETRASYSRHMDKRKRMAAQDRTRGRERAIGRYLSITIHLDIIQDTI